MEVGTRHVSDNDFAHALWAGLATVAWSPQEHALLQQQSGFEPYLVTDAPCDPTPLACWPSMPTYQSMSYEAECSVDPVAASASPSPPMPRVREKSVARPKPRRSLLPVKTVGRYVFTVKNTKQPSRLI
ncbi:hypothetical protein N7471_010724 [Penicillium samsonianum]|uniref:uncharacterized protein n=1 Tax=Penicillium samsonianum TaxID=1882272 RepID=UPI002548FF1A|nr:uncharacterized protein N7471_010724 [Penicillium samsonianum]KAJ6126231.1 hypothetical protein N7471_010724 [Penicillium samsonianum]